MIRKLPNTGFTGWAHAMCPYDIRNQKADRCGTKKCPDNKFVNHRQTYSITQLNKETWKSYESTGLAATQTPIRSDTSETESL